MYKVIATIVTPVAALLMFAGTAHASEITTSNDASEGSSSYEGTSNDTAASNTQTGLVTATPPGTVLKVIGYKPVLDSEGNQVYQADGVTPMMFSVFESLPISSGVAPATIVHN
ncbi:hypothetical protein ACH47B_13445 [Rhodococcus sp. NPDC019627]|uniref:hypothetical protein n=1 Tax=unclassified Rhodococcus (in: high G+C Gram-positive bacteria) TaxID=192944 RepID=UPI0033FFD0F1